MIKVVKPMLSSSAALSLALMAGRMTGFVRELMLANTFGMTAQADVAVIVLSMPDLLVNLLLSGGLSVALIPALRQASEGVRSSLFLQSSLVVFLLFCIFSVVFQISPERCLKVFAPGMVFSDVNLHYLGIIALAASIPLVALAGVSSAALNANDQFFVAGCGTFIFNFFVIASLWFAFENIGSSLNWLCAGILFGAFFRWMSQIIFINGNLRFSLYQFAEPWMIGKELIATFIAGLTAATLLIIVPVYIRAVASFIGEGQIAAFNYAMKIVELPVGILITAVATVLYPKLSQSYAEGDEKVRCALLENAMCKSLLLSFSVVICGIQFSDAAVKSMFSFGNISSEQQRDVVDLMRVALLSVPSIGVVSILSVALNANNRAAQVLKLNFGVLLLLPLLSWPGYAMQTPALLMASLPLFYLILVLVFLIFGGLNWPIRSWKLVVKPTATMLLASFPFVVIDRISALYLDETTSLVFLRTSLAVVCWMVVVYFGLGLTANNFVKK